MSSASAPARAPIRQSHATFSQMMTKIKQSIDFQIAVRALPFAGFIAFMFLTVGQHYGPTLRAGFLFLQVTLGILSVGAWVWRPTNTKE